MRRRCDVQNHPNHLLLFVGLFEYSEAAVEQHDAAAVCVAPDICGSCGLYRHAQQAEVSEHAAQYRVLSNAVAATAGCGQSVCKQLLDDDRYDVSKCPRRVKTHESVVPACRFRISWKSARTLFDSEDLARVGIAVERGT